MLQTAYHLTIRPVWAEDSGQEQIMALGFFRKRQKLIFALMILLMVTFLISFQGVEMFFRDDPNDEPVGYRGEEPITVAMVKSATFDLEMLNRLMQGYPRGSEQAAAYQMMRMGSADQTSVAYALLLEEANEKGMEVTAQELANEIDALRANGFDYDGFAASLRSNQGITEEKIRGSLGRWLMIFKAYRSASVSVPPSRQQLLQLFRDVDEKIDLRVVPVRAETFLGEVPDPTDEQVREHFETYRNHLGGEFVGIRQFDFGYLRPPRVKLAWLLVDRPAIERATVPTGQEIEAYFQSHRKELTAQANPSTTTRADGVEDLQPISLAEARPIIIEQLRPELARATFEDIVRRVNRMVRVNPRATNQPGDGESFVEAVDQLTLPPDDLLQRRIPIIAVENQPLREAVAMIAAQATPSIKAIAFPWGKHGELTVSPDLKVTLIERNLTVAQALEKLAAQVPDLPKLKWAAFDGIDSVLFPVGGIRIFPVRAERTDWLSRREIMDRPILSNSFWQSKQGWVPLANLAMEADPIRPDSEFSPGQDGPIMNVYRDEIYLGQLLWRLLEAQPSSSPQTLTDELRAKVIADWKLAEAFKLAETTAASLSTPADQLKWAREHDVTPVTTGLVSRKERFAIGGGYFQPARLEKMEFASSAVDQYVLEKAFEDLSPENLETGNYEPEGETILALPLECEAYVLTARRLDYRPALQSEFRREKPMLMMYVSRDMYSQVMRGWFRFPQIRLRNDFRYEGQDDQGT
jgi:hypothetical protein